MIVSSDGDIERLARAFEDTTLPRDEWTHEAHLVVALWYLRHHPRPAAVRRMREGILRYIARHGARSTGYHETITVAWFAVIARFLDAHDHGQPVSDLAGPLLAECGASDYLFRFYSRDVLMSDESKRRYVPPDLGPIETPGGASTVDVTYALEPGLTADEFVDVLARSTLAERRPVGEPGTIERMLRHADLVVTARVGGVLVGVSRAISDFSFCTYLSDLAVDRAYQRLGIGRELIRRTHEAAGLGTTLILLAAPAARGYYPHIGMDPHDSCWIIPRRS
jgi:GNAT superfamily N-acetyltransferase